MAKLFQDRRQAGKLLAEKLVHYARQNAMVLALPRGGVPVGYEIAQALHLPLDVFLVRKLGVPRQPELAFGAIASGGVQVFNDEVMRFLQATEVAEVIAQEQQVLAERHLKYRENRPFPDLRDRTVILVDDGIATGATMRAAIIALRQLDCQHLVIAIPVGPPEVFQQFYSLAEEIVCLQTPTPFFAIGNWYVNFPQTADEEVFALLGNH